ncbi:MAG: UbiH/UbiF/VisC/COQ6 family ubiquinone biosynthesis hydroxylase [Oleispira antarctica]|nr:UbiH/UbiF/VisC/COQ6 family ubiquinone biosynthesis hydroxylase [Oleispira antarctica]MBQ0791034.1 UbiH/UbiF/VisC/COQ6 family ubiquinone biosynthesis hydroxylase [Oleispira antarctica]
MMQPKEDYQVVIVGGGMVGNALAAALANSDISVALIEPNTAQQPPLGKVSCNEFDTRVSAITAQSEALLTQLGVWALIPAAHKSPYQGMTVWDADGTGEVNFNANELHVPCLGTIVENREIVWALQQVVEQAKNVEILRDTVTHIDNQDEQGLTPAFLSSGKVLKTQLLVGADGALSRVKQWGEFATCEWDYKHHALVATVELEKSHQQTAWQRFRPEGPLALLPLAAENDKTCSIVWSTNEEECEQLLSMNEEAFCQQLGLAFEHRLGQILNVGPRAAVPLRQRHAKNYVVPGIALVGDAAHTIHPLAGQGVNLGFKDITVLSEELLRAQKLGLNLGELASLQRYQRRRQTDNLIMMAAMEGFKRLFAAEQPIIRLLRNQGMRLFNRAAAVKQHVVMQAMGLK